MRRSPTALMTVGVFALLAGATGSFATTTQVRAASTPIGFSTPNVMDPMESVGEPTIVHSPAADNTVYASGPWGTGTQRSLWHASADLGETFRLVQQCPPTSGFVATVCPAPTAVTGTANPPGGGDTDQRVDSSGKDYFVDLWALACDRVATTTDHGATANQNAYGCNSPTTLPSSRPDGSDRQWLSIYDPKLTGVTSTAPDKALAPLTYMEYNNLQTVQNGCSYWIKSSDGISYTPANNDTGNFGCDGYPSVDQVTGKVFEASGCNGTALCLNIGTPDAAGNLCFLDDPGPVMIGGNAEACAKGSGLITAASGLAGDPDLLFTVSSMDTGRNLHITFAVSPPSTDTSNKNYQVFTTVAPANNATAVGGCTTNCWNNWAKPVQVSQAPSNVNVFPWVIAGGPGRSDSVWYGTSTIADPSSNSGQAWNVYMNQVVWPVDGTGAVTLAAPSTNMVKVSPHPNHYNSICLQGTGCITSQGDRNLADFFSVVIDHNGAAEVEYDDTSNALEQAAFTPVSGLADHPGGPVVTIARQDSGPGLLGTDVTTRPNEPTAAPTVGQSDPAGDGLYPVIGGANVPALDFVNSPTTGNLANKLALSADGKTLTVTMNVADLSGTGIANATTAVPGGQFLQYVTRWVQCGTYSGSGAGNCLIYYAMAETHVLAGQAGQFQFFGGAADSIDLCSVSACDPHVEVYPEGVSTAVPTATGATESGTVNCPATPSATTPCTISITVNTADIGSPTASTLLEEVGSYAFASAYLQSQITNPQAEADLLPLLVDGVCCFNFQGSAPVVVVPEAPWAPGLMLGGAVMIGAGALLRRRSRRGLTAC